MDMMMDGEQITATEHPIWDVVVDGNGCVPVINGETEDSQGASVAVFLQQGLIPILPEAGVPWTDFLTKKITFGDLDSAIRNALKGAGHMDYMPDYYMDGDRLAVHVVKNKGV